MSTTSTAPARRSTMLRRLARLLVLAPLLGAALAAVSSTAPASAVTGCTVPPYCIDGLDSNSFSGSLGANFYTSVKTKARLYVYLDHKLVAKSKRDSFATYHDLDTAEVLHTDTVYDYRVVTVDAQGHRISQDGTQRTARRQVTITFDSIKVTHDSDKTSDGDFRIWLGAGDEVPLSLAGEVGSGTTVPLDGQTVVVPSAGTSTRAHVEMYDDDQVDLGLPAQFPDAPTWTSGHTATGDWATASRTLDTRSVILGTLPFRLTIDKTVGFVVKGHVGVTFVPQL